MKVSIVTPAYNSASMIEDCLAALLPEAREDVEIIVVDDASTDDTAARAERAGARVVRCASNVGPAEARNRGAAAAGGEILFFVDADVIAAPGALARVLDTLEKNPEVASVFGSYDDEPRAGGVVSPFRNLLHHYVHQTGNTEAFTFWAGCGAVRRQAFEEVGGFDADKRWFSIEDIELGYRLRAAGHRIVIDKQLQGKHLKRWTLRSLVKTDLFYRAIPWTRLILQSGAPPSDLNVQGAQKLALALVAIACLTLPAALFEARLLWVAIAALAGVVWVNRGLYGFLARIRGVWFAAASFPVHLLYYICSGLGFAAGQVLHRTVGPRSTGPEPSRAG